MDLLLGILMQWLVVNKDLTIDKKPIVMLVSPEVIVELTGQPSKAIYTPVHRIIYLSKEVDLSTFYGKSILLHELVHHYQALNNRHRTYDCFRQAEYLAYTIQREYLEQNNIKIPEDLSKEHIKEISSCE